MTHEAQPLGHAHQNLTRLLTVRLVHGHVTHPLGALRPAIVECRLSLEGAVDELVWNEDLAGLDVFLERTTGCCGYDVSAAFRGQGPNVGTVVYGGGVDGVFLAVSGRNGREEVRVVR